MMNPFTNLQNWSIAQISQNRGIQTISSSLENFENFYII